MNRTVRKPEGRTLVTKVRDALLEQIEGGAYSPGDRLPSEAKLTEEFSVSRTVVREAIASLRADGLVEPRQGAGIFVLAPPAVTALPFRNVDPARVSSMIEILELRTAVEAEAAALAAQRRSPAQEEAIIEAYRAFSRQTSLGEASADADFALHLAIADATNNPRFREFLTLAGTTVIPRRSLGADAQDGDPAEYLAVLVREHEAIVNAILDGDETAAREAMRHHLRGSQSRYRRLLHRTS